MTHSALSVIYAEPRSLKNIAILLLSLQLVFSVGVTADDYWSGDPLDAIAEYQRRLQRDPPSAEIHTQLGHAYAAVEDFENAFAHYQRALKLNPNLTLAHYRLGVLYSNQHQFTNAIRAYQRAIALDSSVSQTYAELGYVYTQIYQFTEGIAAY